MENTIENKIRFFAQYLGSRIEYPDTDGKTLVANLTGLSRTDGIETTYNRKKKGCSGDYLALKSNGHHDSNALSAKILLTPLSQITDEDAIEVAKIFNQHKIKAHYNEADLRDYLIKEGKQYASRCEHYVVIYQYLQSKCYALPFMGLSVEQLIEYGWLRLKN